MAPRLRTKPESEGAAAALRHAESGVRDLGASLSSADGQPKAPEGCFAERSVFARLIVAGLIALALLGLGEQAPAAFPVHVSMEAHSAAGQVQVNVDGETHAVSSALGGDWRRLVLDQPGPVDREYQIDGSDTTATGDRNSLLIADLLNTPLYQFDAFLRDESSYSRWEHLTIVDLTTGQQVAPDAALPTDFRIDVDLRRPEAVARIWLVNATGNQREGLELSRDMRNARWVMDRGQGIESLPRWFFPEQPAPFAAELVQLLGRSAVVSYALVLVALGMGFLLAAARRRTRRWTVRSKSDSTSDSTVSDSTLQRTHETPLPGRRAARDGLLRTGTGVGRACTGSGAGRLARARRAGRDRAVTPAPPHPRRGVVHVSGRGIRFRATVVARRPTSPKPSKGRSKSSGRGDCSHSIRRVRQRSTRWASWSDWSGWSGRCCASR